MQRDDLHWVEIFEHFYDGEYPITDTHCHLSLIQERDKEFIQILKNFCSAYDILIIDVGINPNDYFTRLDNLHDIKNIYFSLGMHPCESLLFQETELSETIIHAIKKKKPIAIGEIGLDWYRMYAPKQTQIRLFKLQIEIAIEYKLPIIIHSRKSLDDVINIVKSYNYVRNEGIGIVHCFEGNSTQAKKCLDLGFYISFAANLSYSSAQDLRTLIKYVPKDRLIAETDSPYLLHKNIQKFIKKSKKKYNGINYPLYLSPLYSLLAECLDSDTELISKIIRENSNTLFHITE